MNEEELQQLSAQYLAIENQIKILELRKREIEKVLKHLENYNGKILKMIGDVILEESKEKIIEELSEEKEIIETRLKVLYNQREKIRKTLESVNLEGSNLSG